MGLDGVGWGWMGLDGVGWGWMGLDGVGWGWMGLDGVGWAYRCIIVGVRSRNSLIHIFEIQYERQ
jgi:hypothetical protein